MSTCLQLLLLLLLPAASALAQAPGEPNNFNGRRPPGRPPGDAAAPGPRAAGPVSSNGMFAALDADGDGVISKTELRRAVVQLKKLDADKDGNITLAEAGATGGVGGDPAQQLQRIWENDKNGDGKLTVDELPEDVQPLLQGADRNRDGAIDRAELATVMDNMRNQSRGVGPGGFPGGPNGFRGAGGFGNQPFDANQMTGQLLQNDRNGDGKLSPDEVPPQAMGILQGGDQNGDGAIDAAEMQSVLQRMGERARGLNAGFGANRGDNAPGRGDTGRNRPRPRDDN